MTAIRSCMMAPRPPRFLLVWAATVGRHVLPDWLIAESFALHIRHARVRDSDAFDVQRPVLKTGCRPDPVIPLAKLDTGVHVILYSLRRLQCAHVRLSGNYAIEGQSSSDGEYCSVEHRSAELRRGFEGHGSVV